MFNSEYKRPVGRAVCNDGVSLSIQASEFHYCTPRDNEGPYSHKEVGFISDKEGNSMAPPVTWTEYAEDEFPSDVYGWVPVELIEAFIVEHGGRAE